MKTCFTILLLMIVIGVKGQTRVKSQFLGDSIIFIPDAVEMRPTIVNAHGDTARWYYWSTGSISRNLVPGFNLTTFYYDKNAQFLTQDSFSILGSQLPNLALIKLKMDSLIRVTHPRIVTQ